MYGGAFMIKWKDEYNLGVEKIDEQHRKLFEIADKGYELLKDEFCTDKYDRIVAILEELRGYTVYHFQFEEEYMQSIAYKKYLSHKVEHDDFVEKIKNINLKELDDKQDQYIIDILDFVIKWITGHILGTDRQYVKS